MPKILCSSNKNIDIEEILQFAKERDPYIFEWFPDLKDVSSEKLSEAVKEAVDLAYEKYAVEIDAKINFLNSQKELFEKIMNIMSEICETNWDGIENIDIFLGVNPIAPRNLQRKYFAVPVYESEESLLKFCSHELLHFIYFKKFHEIFGDKYETYEYPHSNWVLSEILAPVILSDGELQKLVLADVNLYPHWAEFNERYKLIEIFSTYYNEGESFQSFLAEAKRIYEKMDAEFELTKKMTS